MADSGGPVERPVDNRTGGSLLEVVIAVVVLAFGMLAMATTSTVVVRQTAISNLTNQRVATAQLVAERLRSMPFDSVGSGAVTHGQFGVSWSVTSANFRAKQVQVVTTGPVIGVTSNEIGVPDTLSYTIIR